MSMAQQQPREKDDHQLWSCHPAVARPKNRIHPSHPAATTAAPTHPSQSPTHPSLPTATTTSPIHPSQSQTPVHPSHPSAVVTPTVLPSQFSDRGVSLQALIEFSEKVPKAATTAQVVETLITPEITRHQCALSQLLPPHQLAQPTHLVVHSWSSTFHSLVEQLTTHFARHPKGGPTPYLWLDIFAVPPPPSPSSPSKSPKDLHADITCVNSVMFTTTSILVVLGPDAHALTDLHCLHTLAAAVASKRQHQLLLLASPPLPLPSLLHALPSLHLASASTRHDTDREPLLQWTAATISVVAPATASPSAAQPTTIKPLDAFDLVLRRALLDGLHRQSAALEAEAAAGGDCVVVSDALFLEAALLLVEKELSALGDDTLAVHCMPEEQERQLEAAEKLAERCLAVREAREASLGGACEGDGRVAAACQLLGEVVRLRASGGVGQLERSLQLMKRAGARWATGGASQVLHAARAHVWAAKVLLELERPVEAQELAQRALTSIRTAPAARPNDLAAAHTALGIALYRQGELGQAADALHEAGAYHCGANSVGHRQRRAASLVFREYSLVLLQLGKGEQAEQWARRAVAAAEEVFGAEASPTADCMEALGVILLEQCCNTVDEEQEVRSGATAAHVAGALEACGGGAGSNDSLSCEMSSVSVSRSACGIVAKPGSQEGRWKEAEELLRRRLRCVKQVYGRGHPKVLRSSCVLARALHRARQYQQAEQVYLAVLQCLQEGTPPRLLGLTVELPDPGPSSPDTGCRFLPPVGTPPCCAIVEPLHSPLHSPNHTPKLLPPLQFHSGDWHTDSGSPSSAVFECHTPSTPFAAYASHPLLYKTPGSAGELTPSPTCMDLGLCRPLPTWPLTLYRGQASGEMSDDSVCSGDQGQQQVGEGGRVQRAGSVYREVQGQGGDVTMEVVLQELASVYDEWGRPQNAGVCRRQSSLHHCLTA